MNHWLYGENETAIPSKLPVILSLWNNSVGPKEELAMSRNRSVISRSKVLTELLTTGKIRESQGIFDDREKSGKVREFGQKVGFIFVFFGKLGILKRAPGLLDFDNPR